MARSLSRREITLAALMVAAAVGLLWYRSGTTPEGTPGAASRARGEAGAAVAPTVRLDLLAKGAESYGADGRDLFQYAIRPPSAEEIRQRQLEAERQRARAEAEAKLRQEAYDRQAAVEKVQREELVRNPPKPQPPPINLKYVGYMGPKNDKVAVFIDGEDTVVAKKGEVVKGQFVVVDIKYETVVMGFTRPEFKDQTRELSLSAAAR